MQFQYSFMAPFVLVAVFSAGLGAQTAIDVKTQTRNIDFSGAVSTRPFKTGATLPATCTTGESFFKSNAAAGQNLYGCTAANTWIALSGSLTNTGVTAGIYGTSGSVAQITVDAQGRITAAADVAVSGGGGGISLPGVGGQAGRFLTNNGTGALWQDFSTSDVKDCSATLAGGVLTAAACAARNGNLDVSAPACTLSLTGVSASGAVYGFVSGSGLFTVGHNSAATLDCAGWTVATGVTSFPDDALPLFTASFSSNSWTVGGVTPSRRLVGRDAYAAGDGLSSSNSSATGVTTLLVDSTQIPRYFTGSAVPSQNCTQGRDFYLNTATAALYQCTTANSWTAVGSGGGGAATVTAQRYLPWGVMRSSGSNSTAVLAANETRWHQLHLTVQMTVSGIGMRSTVGIGAGEGMRFAIANSAGSILYKTGANTTCASGSLCQASLPSAATLPAGVYYLGMTTDSVTFRTGQLNALGEDGILCALSNAGTAPFVAGTGTPGTGTSSSVDFPAAMGTLATYPCNSGTNTLVTKFHDMYLF